ncbi:hypothetical protein ACLOJK_024300 [Asimina triloba]
MTCCTSRADDSARSYGRWKSTRTLVALGPELGRTAASLRSPDFPGPSRDGTGHGGCNTRTRTFVAPDPELGLTAASLRSPDFPGPLRDGAGHGAWNETRSDNPMGQATKKKDAGMQHKDFPDGIRCISAGMIAPMRLALENRLNHTTSRQSLSPMGYPSRTAAVHGEGPIVPFPTTCCTSRADGGARSYGCRNLAWTFIAPGPELGHTTACLRGSDFSGPSSDDAGHDARNGMQSDNLMGQAAKKKDAGVQHEYFPRSKIRLTTRCRWAARRQSFSPAGGPSCIAATPDEGPVVPFPTTCCTSRADDDARSYDHRKSTRTFVSPGPELGRMAACLRGSKSPGLSRDGAGRGAQNGTRSNNPMGQAAKKKDAGVQHENFPRGWRSKICLTKLRHDPALRRWTDRWQSSSPAGGPGRIAAALDEGPVVPFLTTCCISCADNGARSYGRRKSTQMFIAPGPELGRTVAFLRGSDFPGLRAMARGTAPGTECSLIIRWDKQ